MHKSIVIGGSVERAFLVDGVIMSSNLRLHLRKLLNEINYVWFRWTFDKIKFRKLISFRKKAKSDYEMFSDYNWIFVVFDFDWK